MNTFPTTDNGATRLLAYYEDKGLSPELAKRLVDDPPLNPTPPWVPPAPDPDEFAVKVIATPNAHTDNMVALAKAYESQRERIADLEDEVDLLRPVEAFVSETIYAASDAEKEIEIECLGTGLLRVTVDDTDEGCAVDIDLDEVQATNLATNLARWAGLDGEVKS